MSTLTFDRNNKCHRLEIKKKEEKNEVKLSKQNGGFWFDPALIGDCQF